MKLALAPLTLQALLWSTCRGAFVLPSPPFPTTTTARPALASVTQEDELVLQKKKLLGIIRPRAEPVEDPVLADPLTKESLQIAVATPSPTILGGVQARRKGVKYVIKSATNEYEGSSDRFLNLLEPVVVNDQQNAKDISSSNFTDALLRSATPLIPPPLRAAFASAGIGSEYIPMRDLFTSPAVSFAYERGWRQNFRTAGFPGPDKEFQMAVDFFAPAMERYADSKVLVDMSCATGLFTRRFAKSGKYKRVLGCDYSESMLDEARRRINRDRDLSSSRQKNTRLDLVRLDVGQIPMKNASVDALHAGAAMHCWPDLPKAAAEIYRVLKPGGRYFATTFLSSWFATLRANGVEASEPSRQAFQYFESVDVLKSLLVSGGFEADKVDIEVIKPACVVIRCEK